MLSDNQVIRYILAFKIKHLRHKHDLSYQELSNLTGLSTSYLSDIEKGNRYPKPDKITSLAKAFGVEYNYLVSTDADKKIKPAIDLLDSQFLKLFPLDQFGISIDKMLQLLAQTPDQVNAFISTIFKIARNYQIDEPQFYLEALRSYQDMNNNHFPDLEESVIDFKEKFSIKNAVKYETSYLEDQLAELYDISIDRVELSNNPKLKRFRSFYSVSKKTLYLRTGLSSPQENFLIARELAFQFLKLEERPYETSILDISSFQILLNNYKASHFAAALLINTDVLVEDIKAFSRLPKWNSKLLLNLLKKYNVSAEMLLQRLTNVLPHYFGLEDLFFLKLIGHRDSTKLVMSKNLHLSKLHNPYNNLLDEDFCGRWIAARSIKEVFESDQKIVVETQISDYDNSENSYFCFSIAELTEDKDTAKNITIGILVSDKLKSKFSFVTDPKVTRKLVGTTCQRCNMDNCLERKADPTIIEKLDRDRATLEELDRYR